MKKTKPRSPSVADALLDAHVAFVVEQLRGGSLEPLVDSLLDATLEDAAALKLEQMVTRDMIKATARAYAVELELGGGIPELVGDVARALHAHPVHERTRLGDLLSQRRFEDLLDQLLALKALRRRLVGGLLASPLYERMASDLLYNGIRDYLANTSAPAGIPGARSALKLGRAVVKRATAGFEDAIEENLKRQIGRTVANVTKASGQALLDGDRDEALRDIALDSWASLRRVKIGDLRKDLTALELEELFVTLYEAWKELRQTPLIGGLIDAGIDVFFDKYGDESLAALLEDLGVDRAMMRVEAMRFAPHVIARLHEAGRLESIARRVLEPFYKSGRVEKILKDPA